MRIIVTGGFGFLGRRVAAALLERGTFRGAPIGWCWPTGSPTPARR
jgi:uncharacterized protein YbjT (DUF2867 family)